MAAEQTRREQQESTAARRLLHCEADVDPLLLYVGCTLFAQSLLLKGEPAEARPILRELVNLAPSLLRATYDGWGYSRPYCLLEQMWLEAYAAMVVSSRGAEPRGPGAGRRPKT